MHYGAGPDKGSAVSLLRATPSAEAATSPEYAYVLGLVDRFSSPLLEPFVDGALADMLPNYHAGGLLLLYCAYSWHRVANAANARSAPDGSFARADLRL